MFNFKTDFFSQPKIGQIIERDKENDSQEIEAVSPPDPAEQQQRVEQEDVFEQPDFEMASAESGDTDHQEVEAFPAEPDAEGQAQDEAFISETRVFYHPGHGCIDTAGAGVLDCTNTPVDITGLPGGVVAKIPVVLAELNVQVNLDSIITLPERALEIKEIKKNVKLTQCLLLQDPDEIIPPMLFLKGFVRKNIAYATKSCSNQEGVCGDVRHCTVDVPFSCTTPVEFNGADPDIPMVNTISEFQYFRREDLSNRRFPEKDELLSGDFSEFNQVTQEFYNELPYCELVSARIVEYDEFINRTRPAHELPLEEREFSKIEEKTVLFLTIKVLQNQQVQIPAVVLTAPAPGSPFTRPVEEAVSVDELIIEDFPKNEPPGATDNHLPLELDVERIKAVQLIEGTPDIARENQPVDKLDVAWGLPVEAEPEVTEENTQPEHFEEPQEDPQEVI